MTAGSPGAGETKGRERRMQEEARAVVAWKMEKPISLRSYEPRTPVSIAMWLDSLFKEGSRSVSYPSSQHFKALHPLSFSVGRVGRGRLLPGWRRGLRGANQQEPSGTSEKSRL